MMRRHLGSVALAALFAACDSPLDTNPTASIDTEIALTTARGIELAMNGAYRQLQSGSLFGRQEQAFNDMYADNLDFTGTFTGDREVSLRNINPANGEVGGIWSAAYIGVNRANYILDALPTVSELSDAQKTRFRGEALFLRGLFYSLLVKYYGGVPLVDKPPPKRIDDSLSPARNTQQETYAFIIRDLEEAVTLLGTARAHGRATQGAANALLARVYLEDGKYTQARDKATLVINNTLYRLTTTFREIFTLKNNNESIFELQFTVGNTNSLAFWFFPTALGGRLGFAPSTALYDAYEPGDTRRDASIATCGSTRYGYKFYRIAQGDDNVPILRLAEQHLIRAEANARLSVPAPTVHADINILRKRAGLADLDVSIIGQQALLDAILQERRVELAFEGHRFADLRRHGKAEAVLRITTNKLLWPIPLYETDVNDNLVQNPGY